MGHNRAEGAAGHMANRVAGLGDRKAGLGGPGVRTALGPVVLAGRKGRVAPADRTGRKGRS
ncbi:hypothetical protein GCM10009736_13660 [Actinomadura bangladeshensis]